ncbi:MAG TPA: 30S ribosomal protein S2 [Spirochaetia bacterium]|nr:MAG: 30S ribosomal protein S2 [Spirochaetes bacterium GWB1_36_13]HCL57519.1 30S ribosomal protein S2 [Spirochaetia bacterium]
MSEAFTMKELLEAGVHFGHQIRRWNPKMKKFIYTKRNGIHIIDLQKTAELANKAYEVMKQLAAANKKILFVCTKKQGQESIKEAAVKCGMPFINKRWPGGLLTNFITVKESINKMKRIERMEADGSLEKLTKKERNKMIKKKEKIDSLLGGLKELSNIPDAMFVIDTVREKNGIIEAKRLGMTIIAMVDTNSDPDLIDHPIPANDDAIRAIKLFSDKMSQSVNEGLSEATGGEAGENQMKEEDMIQTEEETTGEE